MVGQGILRGQPRSGAVGDPVGATTFVCSDVGKDSIGQLGRDEVVGGDAIIVEELPNDRVDACAMDGGAAPFAWCCLARDHADALAHSRYIPSIPLTFPLDRDLDAEVTPEGGLVASRRQAKRVRPLELALDLIAAAAYHVGADRRALWKAVAK